MHTDLPAWIDGGSREPLPPRHPRRGGGAWWLVVASLVAVAGAAVAVTALRPQLRARGLSGAGLSRLLRGRGATGGRAHGAAAPSSAGPLGIGSLPAPLYGPNKLPPPWSGPLPYPLLIADAGSGQLVEVAPNGKVLWQYPQPGAPAAGAGALAPSDASFAADGGSVVVASERQDLVARIDFYARRVGWQFGVAGQAADDAAHLDYPDDAEALPNGNVIVADIRNCRVLILAAGGAAPTVWGKPQSGYCQTDPAAGLFGYPNGVAPQADGSVLVSFSSGDHVALLSPAGKVLWDATAPNLYGGFVSDAELLPGGDVLVCGYGNPGSVVQFAPVHGGVAWHYFVASGSGALNDPTTALPLPGGDVAVADGGNHRVVVIDPTTNQIVWQYATGLQDPEGIDLDVYRDWQGWLAAAAGKPAAPAGR